MIGAGGNDVDQSMPRQSEDRLGIAGAERTGRLDRLRALDRRAAGGQRRVDFQPGAGARGGDRRAERLFEIGAKLADARPGQRL
jgi:hypothetical protein